jgi:hypothetical protein
VAYLQVSLLWQKAYLLNKQESCEHSDQTEADSRKWAVLHTENVVAYNYSPKRLSMLENVIHRKLENL